MLKASNVLQSLSQFHAVGWLWSCWKPGFFLSGQLLASLLSVGLTLPQTADDFQKPVEITLQGIVSILTFSSFSDAVWAQWHPAFLFFLQVIKIIYHVHSPWKHRYNFGVKCWIESIYNRKITGNSCWVTNVFKCWVSFGINPFRLPRRKKWYFVQKQKKTFNYQNALQLQLYESHTICLSTGTGPSSLRQKKPNNVWHFNFFFIVLKYVQPALYNVPSWTDSEMNTKSISTLFSWIVLPQHLFTPAQVTLAQPYQLLEEDLAEKIAFFLKPGWNTRFHTVRKYCGLQSLPLFVIIGHTKNTEVEICRSQGNKKAKHSVLFSW